MAIDLGLENITEVGVGANRANRSDAHEISNDWNKDGESIGNPVEVTTDAGPNTGSYARSTRQEDATYSLSVLQTPRNYALFKRLQWGQPANFWINPVGKAAGDPYFAFESVTTVGEGKRGGFATWELQAMLNGTTTSTSN